MTRAADEAAGGKNRPASQDRVSCAGLSSPKPRKDSVSRTESESTWHPSKSDHLRAGTSQSSRPPAPPENNCHRVYICPRQDPDQERRTEALDTVKGNTQEAISAQPYSYSPLLSLRRRYHLISTSAERQAGDLESVQASIKDPGASHVKMLVLATVAKICNSQAVPLLLHYKHGSREGGCLGSASGRKLADSAARLIPQDFTVSANPVFTVLKMAAQRLINFTEADTENDASLCGTCANDCKELRASRRTRSMRLLLL